MDLYELRSLPRVSQGDIYRDIEVFDKIQPGERILRTRYGYAVVLTQDCDLEQDWNANIRKVCEEGAQRDDKILRHILLAPCYVAEQFQSGEHIEGRRMHSWNSKEFKKVRDNKLIRYHYLPHQDGLPLPNLVIDFKHYFTVERDLFYAQLKQYRICSLKLLFREALSQRFAAYLARIGIPSDGTITWAV